MLLQAATALRSGIRYMLTEQPLSRAILLLPFTVGLLGAIATGLAVGFGDTEDPTVGDVRVVGALLTGLAAGGVGRGLWGWLAASVGGAIGFASFLVSEMDLATLAFGGLIFSSVILAPGYGLARLIAYTGQLISLDTPGRTAALRLWLRRGLRLGAALSGVILMVAAISAVALAEDPTSEVLGMLVIGAAWTGSYVLYRLVDRLDRGERGPAALFTVVYAPVGFATFGLMLDGVAQVTVGVAALAALETLVPGLLMALAPWLLAHVAGEQAAAAGQHRV